MTLIITIKFHICSEWLKHGRLGIVLLYSKYKNCVTVPCMSLHVCVNEMLGKWNARPYILNVITTNLNRF